MTDEAREVLEQYFTYEAISRLDNLVEEDIPEHGIEVTLQISNTGELDGIDIN